MNTNHPTFDSPDFLEQHMQSTLAFYEPRAYSPEGGFYSCFLDNADCFDPYSRQLVGSARYVVNYATAYRLYGKPQHLQWAQWGLDYLTNVHKQDNVHGAWFRVRNRDGSAIDNVKSPLGKTDYHTMGACWDVLSVG